MSMFTSNVEIRGQLLLENNTAEYGGEDTHVPTLCGA